MTAHRQYVKVGGCNRSKRWLNSHHALAVKEPRRRKTAARVDDPDYIAFMRSIVEKIDRITNPIFRDHLCQLLKELERIKRDTQLAAAHHGNAGGNSRGNA